MDVERWGWYSVAVTVAIGVVHGLIAMASGSVAITAELLHNTTDLLTALAVVAGLKLAARKSAAFPYGLYKLENLIAVALAGAVFLTAYEIARHALAAEAHAVIADGWMIAGLAATTALAAGFGRLELAAGRRANSPALVADAREYLLHVFTTGLVLAALVGEWFALPLDRWAALLIVPVVVKTGWDLLRDGMRALLDASLDAETILAIRTAIATEPAVVAIDWVSGRNAGRIRFVEAAVRLRTTDFARADQAAGRIEARIRAAVPHIERALVRVQLATAPEICYAVPLADAAGAASAHFGSAPYFGFARIARADGQVQEWRVLPNPHRDVAEKKGIRTAEWLVEQKVDVVLTAESLEGKGPGFVLDSAGVERRVNRSASFAAALEAEQMRLVGSADAAKMDGLSPGSSG